MFLGRPKHTPCPVDEPLAEGDTFGPFEVIHASGHSPGDLAFHWRELYEEITTSATIPVERLRTIAANYGIAKSAWLPLSELPLVDDPLPIDAPHRYDALVDDDPLRLVVKFAERLALEA